LVDSDLLSTNPFLDAQKIIIYLLLVSWKFLLEKIPILHEYLIHGLNYKFNGKTIYLFKAHLQLFSIYEHTRMNFCFILFYRWI